MCPRLLCRHSAGPRRRALLFYVAAWLGWLLGGFELGLTLATDQPYLAFLGTPADEQPPLLAALLAVHAAAAGLGGLIAGRWADSVVETRALVIMAAIPQLLGASLYFFAGTLGELIVARLLSGVGAGAAVAMLCELLRVAPLRVRVAALAGLAMSRELGTDVGPTVAIHLEGFPDLPADVLHHRVTPWNAAGLLLIACHLIYLLLLTIIYPNLTLEREAELLELRRLLFPDATAAEEAEAANPDENTVSDDDAVFEQHPERAESEMRALAERMYHQRTVTEGQCYDGEEEPVSWPRRPPTPSPTPAPPRSVSELAAIGHAFANPGTPQPLLPTRRGMAVLRRRPRPPPPTDEEGLLGAEAAPAESGEDTDVTAVASSLEPELQFPPSSRPPTSDEEKNPLRELLLAPSAADPGEPEQRGDLSLRARRWPGSPDLTVAAPASPLTPAEQTGWFTPDEVPPGVRPTMKDPSTAGSAQGTPSVVEPPQGNVNAAGLTHPAATATEALQTLASTTEASQAAANVTEPPQRTLPPAELPWRLTSAAESTQRSLSSADSLHTALSATESSQRAPSTAGSVQRAPPTVASIQMALSATESTTRMSSDEKAFQKTFRAAEPLQGVPATYLPNQATETASELPQRIPSTAKVVQGARTVTDPPSAGPGRRAFSSKVPPQAPAGAARRLSSTQQPPRTSPRVPQLAVPRAPRGRSLTPYQYPGRSGRHVSVVPAARQLDPQVPLPAVAHQHHQDQLDGARRRHRPLEGPYSDAPEGTPNVLMSRMQFWLGAGHGRRTVAARRMMMRMMRSWERVLCGPTVVLLASCLATLFAQSALSALMPHENGISSMGLTPRWMLGVTALMRLFTSAILLATVVWENGLGTLTVTFSLSAMVAAHLNLALSLMELHGYTFDWDSPKGPTDGRLAWAWILRVALCVQSVASALFEPTALALFSQMVPRTIMGRGVSFWLLAVRAGAILGPFWTVGLIGRPLPQFLTPMGTLAGCVISLVLTRYCYLFSLRKVHVLVLDRIGPRLPVVGLRGRTLSVINHLRQFYCAEPGDAAADAESGAGRASGGGAGRASGGGAGRAPGGGAGRALGGGAGRAPEGGAGRAPEGGAGRAPEGGADVAAGVGDRRRLLAAGDRQ